MGDKIRSYYEEGKYAPCGANMIFQKKNFKKYGGFNEKLIDSGKPIPMCEDTEFCFRVMQNREEILYLPTAVVYHPVFQNRLTKKFFRQHYIKSGRAVALIDSISSNSVRYFNVPRFIFRTLMKNFYQYFLSIFLFNSKRKFFYKLQTLITFGIIYVYLREGGKIVLVCFDLATIQIWKDC